MSKSTYFTKKVLKLMNGDNDEAIAEKIESKARAAIKKQISELEYQLLDEKQNVENAEEEYEKAVYQTHLNVTDFKTSYTKNIKAKHEAVTAAQEKLGNVQYSIEFFNKLLVEKFDGEGVSDKEFLATKEKE